MTLNVLCDVHISYKVRRFFELKGCHAIHVNTILDGCYSSDSSIGEYADIHDYVVVSKDADFKNSHFIKGSPKKLIKIALNNISTLHLINILDLHFETIVDAFQYPTCFMEIGRGYIEVVVA